MFLRPTNSNQRLNPPLGLVYLPTWLPRWQTSIILTITHENLLVSVLEFLQESLDSMVWERRHAAPCRFAASSGNRHKRTSWTSSTAHASWLVFPSKNLWIFDKSLIILYDSGIRVVRRRATSDFQWQAVVPWASSVAVRAHPGARWNGNQIWTWLSSDLRKGEISCLFLPPPSIPCCLYLWRFVSSLRYKASKMTTMRSLCALCSWNTWKLLITGAKRRIGATTASQTGLISGQWRILTVKSECHWSTLPFPDRLA